VCAPVHKVIFTTKSPRANHAKIDSVGQVKHTRKNGLLFYGLEATETKYISLEKLILMELEINRRDLTNRVNYDVVCSGRCSWNPRIGASARVDAR
jgi:hypothetical protein